MLLNPVRIFLLENFRSTTYAKRKVFKENHVRDLKFMILVLLIFVLSDAQRLVHVSQARHVDKSGSLFCNSYNATLSLR